ncbi:fimbrial biogenesis chaperone, partial [Klebsiella pneumoniae]
PGVKVMSAPGDLLDDPAKAWQQLKFSQSGGRLTVINPTPYFVSFYAVEVGGQSIDDPGMVAPFGEKTCPLTGHVFSPKG